MSSAEIRTKRHRAFRKQVRDLVRVPLFVKQIAWRLTAGWFWLCAIAIVFGFGARLSVREDALFGELYGSLLNLGFAPSNPRVFSICVKLLWLFAICRFSWAQIIGFFIYLPFLPLVLLIRVVLRKRLEPYSKIREESFKASRKSGVVIAKRTWGFPLLCMLLLWLVLYGQISAPYPLFLALVLTALLFCSRVSRALAFAVPGDTNNWARVEGMSANSDKFIAQASETFKKGGFLEKWQLNMAIWSGTFFLRISRELSKWLHGKTARRRTALIVLLRFMLNLAALGGISILFWALAIKFVMVPAHVSLLDALSASASCAIPGIPVPSTMKVPVAIQTFDSLTAWLVFVLYAGPVASLFPDFQKQAIARSAANYAKLRDERKKLYRFLEPLRPLQKLVRENPELAKIGKAAIELKEYSEADVRNALLSQPDFVRALVSSPVIVDYMKKLGAPIPDLEELTKEIPAGTVGEGAHSDDRLDSVHNTPQDKESGEGEPVANNQEGL